MTTKKATSETSKAQETVTKTIDAALKAGKDSIDVLMKGAPRPQPKASSRRFPRRARPPAMLPANSKMFLRLAKPVLRRLLLQTTGC